MSFPQRDEAGRIVGLVDLLAVLLAGTLLGLVAVVLIDLAFASVGVGRFGAVSGWLAAVLPFLLMTEEFRAWRPVRGRFLVGLAAALLGLLPGMLAADVTGHLPPVLSGAIGAAVAVLISGTVWFYGVRRLR